ncbi:Cholinesterase [Paramyrothecium foliicola]|nr:Cholinesterase [Paramyrothecium foliicola]
MRPVQSIAGILTLCLLSLSSATCIAHSPPVDTINGTYVGKHLRGYEQDAYLGIPFAKPPTGERRFQRPHYIDKAFSETRNATSYGPACPQYSPPNVFGTDISEDCLTINVVRPAGTKPDAKLPILVWIYGGGFDGGGSSDPRYNMSGLVRLSQDMGKPIVGVSFNYRINKLGFMQSPELLTEGSTNAGFHDQRLALMWIQENIAAFGGDPSRVIIWGESAGAQAIGLHMFTYDGRDDKLYHGAIMESGGPVGAPMHELSFYAGFVESLAAEVGCTRSSNMIKCLRGVPFDKWQAAQTTSLIWNPMVDGELWTDYPSVLASKGKFLRVPVIIGANSDEGCTFATRGINTEEELWKSMLSYRRYNIRPPMAKKLLELYPDDPASQPPYYLNPDPVIFPEQGRLWRRAAAIEGDMVMIAGRRRVAEQLTAVGSPVYSYRFDTLGYGQRWDRGVGHFQNVPFSFQNISGDLGPMPQYKHYRALSEDIGRAYISFVHDYDPNSSRGNASTLPVWPKYNLEHPKNIVLDANGSYIEDDTYRKEGMAFLNEVQANLQIKA